MTTALAVGAGVVSQYCAWFAMCPAPATTTHHHPALGPVPVCGPCKAALVRLDDARSTCDSTVLAAVVPGGERAVVCAWCLENAGWCHQTGGPNPCDADVLDVDPATDRLYLRPTTVERPAPREPGTIGHGDVVGGGELRRAD
jgi:hypothetical protein